MKTMRNDLQMLFYSENCTCSQLKTAIHVTNKKNSIITLYNLHELTPQLEPPISQVLN